VTPRFAPTSSPQQMEMTGALWNEHPGTYLQSHVSENHNEVGWVKELYPERAGYLDIYDHYKQLGPRSIYGHGVWLTEAELRRCHETGTAIAHCPTSNQFLGSGLFNLRNALKPERPVRVGQVVPLLNARPIVLRQVLGHGAARRAAATLGAWQVARLPLHLNTLHPDRAGGLGYLNRSGFAFAPVLLAHAVFLAAAIANRIWNDGAQLSAFKLEVAGILIFLLLLVLVPLTFFSSQLLYAKRRALREYGNVASIYVRDFREKWLEGQNPEGEQLLGTGDIQSLADLGNSFAVTGETRLVPFSKEDVFSLAILLAVPLLPLLLFVFPLEEMIDRIVGLLL